MKMKRNTQKIKEQDKCPPNQTKEEEIGNLPDKEFQIMIVKMIQNLEIKNRITNDSEKADMQEANTLCLRQCRGHCACPSDKGLCLKYP